MSKITDRKPDSKMSFIEASTLFFRDKNFWGRAGDALVGWRLPKKEFDELLEMVGIASELMDYKERSLVYWNDIEKIASDITGKIISTIKNDTSKFRDNHIITYTKYSSYFIQPGVMEGYFREYSAEFKKIRSYYGNIYKIDDLQKNAFCIVTKNFATIGMTLFSKKTTNADEVLKFIDKEARDWER